MNLLFTIIGAIFSGIAAWTGVWSCLDTRNRRRNQLRCRLRFDNGEHSSPKSAPHLRLDVDNTGDTTVCVKSARVVLRSDDGRYMVFRPFDVGSGSSDNETVQPGSSLVFKFFKHRELAREATEEFWRRASIQKPMECAVVRLSDGRVFLAEQKEAQMAIDYFLGRKPLPTMKESPSARETNQTKTTGQENMSNEQQQNTQTVQMTATPPTGDLHHFSANAVPSIGSGRIFLTESVNCVPPIGSGSPPSPPDGKDGNAK